MPKGRLSRVLWPGKTWMPFTFQPTLRVLQQPNTHSYSFQQAIHTQVAHTTFNRLCQFFPPFFLSPRRFLQSTVRPHQGTARPLERAASHINITRPPSLFRFAAMVTRGLSLWSSS